MKKTLKIILVIFFILLILGEIVSRIFPALFAPPPPYNTASLDDKLGWKQKENYQFEGLQQSLDQVEYPVKLSFSENGFRKFSTKEKDSIPRLFIIGDSFIQAIEVSDDKTFYHYLEKDNHFEVFAYGMAGYGTLQEAMIIENYISEINPDIVLLQFCSNDFIDNNYVLEKEAIYRVGLQRPYLEKNDQVVYKSPLGFIERNLDKSTFLKFLNGKRLRLNSKLGLKKKNSSEEKIALLEKEHQAYNASIITTTKIISDIKAMVGPTRQLILMNADAFEPQQKHIAEICKNLSIDYIPFPNHKMNTLKKEKEVFTLDGFHWNENGHQLIGKHLLSHITQSKRNEI